MGVWVQREVRNSLRRYERSRQNKSAQIIGEIFQQDRFSQQLHHIDGGTLDLLPRFVRFLCVYDVAERKILKHHMFTLQNFSYMKYLSIDTMYIPKFQVNCLVN